MAVEPDSDNIKIIQEKVSDNYLNATFQCKNGGIESLEEND
jgi:hypothetical protein